MCRVGHMWKERAQIRSPRCGIWLLASHYASASRVARELCGAARLCSRRRRGSPHARAAAARWASFLSLSPVVFSSSLARSRQSASSPETKSVGLAQCLPAFGVSAGRVGESYPLTGRQRPQGATLPRARRYMHAASSPPRSPSSWRPSSATSESAIR